jgi:hypothetical protein
MKQGTYTKAWMTAVIFGFVAIAAMPAASATFEEVRGEGDCSDDGTGGRWCTNTGNCNNYGDYSQQFNIGSDCSGDNTVNANYCSTDAGSGSGAGVVGVSTGVKTETSGEAGASASAGGGCDQNSSGSSEPGGGGGNDIVEGLIWRAPEGGATDSDVLLP